MKAEPDVHLSGISVLVHIFLFLVVRRFVLLCVLSASLVPRALNIPKDWFLHISNSALTSNPSAQSNTYFTHDAARRISHRGSVQL